MADSNSDVSLDVSSVTATSGEDVVTRADTMDTAERADALGTVRTRTKNAEQTVELMRKYPSEATRVRQMLDLQETSTTDDVLSELERVIRRLNYYEDHRGKLQQMLSHRGQVADENLVAKVEDLLVENDYHKVQANKQERVVQQLQHDKQALLERPRHHVTSQSAPGVTNTRRTASMTALNKTLFSPRVQFKNLLASSGERDNRQNQMNLTHLAKRSRGLEPAGSGKTYQSSAEVNRTKLPEITGSDVTNTPRGGELNVLVLTSGGEEENEGGTLPDIEHHQRPSSAVSSSRGSSTPRVQRSHHDVTPVNDGGKVGVRFDGIERGDSGRAKRPQSRLGRRRSTIHWEKFLGDMARVNYKNDLTKNRSFYRVKVGPEGGTFRVPEIDLTVAFPPMDPEEEIDEAGEEAPTQEIIVGVSWNRSDLPRLRAGQALLSPVLFCLPHDLPLSGPVLLSFPHPLQPDLSDTPLSRRPTPEILHSRTQVGDVTDWAGVGRVDNRLRSIQGDADRSGAHALGEVTSERCVVHTSLLGLFAVTYEFKTNTSLPAVVTPRKNVLLLVFSSIHFKDGFVHLNVCCVDDLPCCKTYMLKEMEGSLFLGEQKLSVAYNNKENITVTMSDLMEGWKLHSETSQTIANKRLWMGAHPSCVYLLKQEVKSLQVVLGRLTIHQHEGEPAEGSIIAQLPVCIDLEQIPGHREEDPLTGGASVGGAGVTAKVSPRGAKAAPPSQTPFHNYPASVESLRQQSSQKWQNKVTHKAGAASVAGSVRMEAMLGRANPNPNPTVWGHTTVQFSGEGWPHGQVVTPRRLTSRDSGRSGLGAAGREGMEALEEEEETEEICPHPAIPGELKERLAQLLDLGHAAGKDWRHLAGLLGRGNWADTLGAAPSPTLALLTLTEVHHTPLEQIWEAMKDMGRHDVSAAIQDVTEARDTL